MEQCDVTIEWLYLQKISLQKQLAYIKKAQFASEQYACSYCLEIRGVAELTQENIIDEVKNVAEH